MGALTTTGHGPTLAGSVTLMPFTDDERRAIMATVAKNCSPAEFTVLMRLSFTYGLDPFAKEIWAIKRNEREPAMIMTSRDGYLKIAQRDAEFTGLKGSTVCENDTFEFDPVTPAVTHRLGHPRGKIVGAWAMATHARRSPVAMYVDFNEYRGTSPIWSKYPSAMILKVAEVLVLKRQVGISGLVTYEEIDADNQAAQGEVSVAQAAMRSLEQEAAERRQRIADAADAYGLTGADAFKLARDKYGATITAADLTDEQVDDLVKKWIPEMAHQQNGAAHEAAPAGDGGVIDTTAYEVDEPDVYLFDDDEAPV